MREEIIQILPVVNVIVCDQDRFLMIQEAKESCQGLWHLPAGGIHKAETLGDAAVREVKEEAGLEIKPQGIFEIHRDIQVPHELWRYVVTGTVIGGTIKKDSDEESLQADWFFIDELQELALRNNLVLPLLERFHKNPTLTIPIESYFQYNQ